MKLSKLANVAIIIALAISLSISTAFAQGKSKTKEANEMTLHDFMEDYTKPATKLLEKKNEDKYLKSILQEIPNLAIDEEKEDWAKIVNKHLDNGDLTGSCKACHSLYKKEYKKTYKKRLILVPESLAGYPEEIKKALKK